MGITPPCTFLTRKLPSLEFNISCSHLHLIAQENTASLHFQPLAQSLISRHHFQSLGLPSIVVQVVHCTRASGGWVMWATFYFLFSLPLGGFWGDADSAQGRAGCLFFIRTKSPCGPHGG